jgi:hypothetical protein
MGNELVVTVSLLNKEVGRLWWWNDKMIDPKVQGAQLPEMFVSIADAKAIGLMNAKKVEIRT